MEKYAIVKQKHLYTNKKNIMYKGMVRYVKENSCTTIQYKEYDTNADVVVCAKDKELRILREADVTSHLCFITRQRTKNELMTEFGKIEIEIFTHKYIKKENIIAVEYDVLQGEEAIDSYRIIWEIKEELT